MSLLISKKMEKIIRDKPESEPCPHPRCALHKQSDMVPIQFEQVETRSLGPFQAKFLILLDLMML